MLIETVRVALIDIAVRTGRVFFILKQKTKVAMTNANIIAALK